MSDSIHISNKSALRSSKLIFILAVFCVAFLPGAVGDALKGSFIEAYLAVSVFVGFTLFLVYGCERLFRFDLGDFNKKNPQWQIVTSTFLGGLPGCGGAIIVLTQFVRGQVSFGAVIAVLTATMGDAAFLLIAAEPLTAAYVIFIASLAGMLTGFAVDAIHGRDYLRVPVERELPEDVGAPIVENRSTVHKWLDMTALAIMLPGIIVGFMLAFQYGIPAHVEEFLGLAGILTLFFVWGNLNDRIPTAHYDSHHHARRFFSRVIEDTAFITIWVVLAFFLFELFVTIFGINLESMFYTVGWLLPLFGVLIGFIPGCGPQIIVTTLYINGLVPLSVQIGNAMSNDGDALFPAIAVAPKAAMVATLYSGVPALILSYIFFFFVD